MQYLLMLYDDEKRWESMTEESMKSGMAAYEAFWKEFAGKIKGGNALQPTHTATTVRTRDGKRLTTDGPYAETKEALGGYYLIDADDLDEAIAIAAKIPGALTGAVEVRPIMTFD